MAEADYKRSDKLRAAQSMRALQLSQAAFKLNRNDSDFILLCQRGKLLLQKTATGAFGVDGLEHWLDRLAEGDGQAGVGLPGMDQRDTWLCHLSVYLVTGGAGFIGSHLCEALVARGDSVRVLDDLSTGRRTNLPRSATLIEGDVTDPNTVASVLRNVDGCFHLAAIASVEKGVTDWLGTHRANITGAVAVFDAIRRQGSKIPVVYASSAAVYGDVAAVPTTERDPCIPLSAYGADKYGCELHARVAAHVHGIPTVGLRLFNVYGPRQDPKSPYSGVISIFCQRIAAGAPVAIFGDGEQTRDFVYVADVVRALLAGMALWPDGAPVFNVCGGVPISVAALARLIADLAGQRLDARMQPPRAGEIRHSVGLPTLADKVLGIPGRVPLRVGLSNVLAWMNGWAG